MRSLWLLTLASVFFSAAALSAPVSKTLVSPASSPEALALMEYLASNYGVKTLSGQEEFDLSNDEVSFIRGVTGKAPAIKSFDLGFYSPVSTWQDDVPARILDWGATQKGIVSLSWHWMAPMGGASFASDKTTFDAARAVTPGTDEYKLVIRDIDAISHLLELFGYANLPILWRPLHEANGRWFWWGAKGPEVYKKLYKLMYDRMVNVNHLDNLIWVWSFATPLSLEWYPGDDCVDIVGADMYNPKGDHSPGRDEFRRIDAAFGGRKMIAYTEDGPLPDPDRMSSEQVHWSWVNTWGGRFVTDATVNSPTDLRRFYGHPDVITLDKIPPK